MEFLLQLLSDLHPDVDFVINHKLIDDGLLDSFDIVSLVGEINDHFKIEITADDLLPDNFNSVEAMLTLIKRLQTEGD